MKCSDCGQEFSKLYAPSKGLCQRCYKRQWERTAIKDPVLHAKIRERAKRNYQRNREKYLPKLKEYREKVHHDSGRMDLIIEQGSCCARCGILTSGKDLIRHHKDRNGRGS